MRKLTLLLILLVARYTAVAADPIWAVNTASFNYSMTVTAVLQLDCVELNATNNRLGAFVGNDLRGSALSSVTVNGRQLVFLTIYSNTVAGETINFKIYNAQTDQIVDAIVTVTFSDDASIGTPSLPRLITDDHVPTNLALSNASITENNSVNAVIGGLSVSDLDVSDTHTFSLVAGQGDTDNGAFSISGNSLRINGMANYEVKTSYSVRIRGQDNYGCGVEKDFAITVLPANDTPTDVILSNTSIAENQPAGSVIGTLSSVDEDANETFTYSLVAGLGSDDNAFFTIDQDVLKAVGSFNFEVKNSYSIRLRTTDAGGATFEKTLAINIIDENEAPYNFQISQTTISENNAINAVIGDLTVQDEDIGDVVTISFAGSNAEQTDFFSIVNNQLLALPSFNFEERNTYALDLIATDIQGLSAALSFTVSIINVNEPPTDVLISNQAIAENEAAGSVIGNLSTVDEDFDETHTYTLVAGVGDTDNASFVLDQNSVKATQTFNYEVKDSYSIRLRTTDSGGASLEEVFIISVIDVNETPFNFQISNTAIEENNAVNAVIGDLSVEDEDIGDVVTISFAGSNAEQANFFGIVNNQLLALPSFNFEVRSSYSVDLIATDIQGLTAALSFTITIVDVNEAPTNLILSNQLIPENEEVGTVIGDLSTVDEDFNETHTYALVAGEGDADNAAFVLDQNVVKATQTFNFEVRNSYSIRLRTTDSGGLSLEEVFVISVIDVNEAPYNFQVSTTSIEENNAVNAVIADLSVQDEDIGDVVTISFAGSNTEQANFFGIMNNQLVALPSFNFEVRSSYPVDLVATDIQGLSASLSFTVIIIDVNEAPTNLTLSNQSIPENEEVGTVVGNLSTVDEDFNETHTYTLVLGEGDADNSLFMIDQHMVKAAETFNFENKSSYSLRVRTADIGGLSFEKSFAISIADVNEVPYDLALSNDEIAENLPIGTFIGNLTAQDEDIDDVVTFSLKPSNTDQLNYFNIVNNQLVSAVAFNFEQTSSFSIDVVATDIGGLSAEMSYDITILDVNEAPYNLSFSTESFVEEQAIGTEIGVFSALDEDTGDTQTYAFVNTGGGNDNASFDLIGNRLLSKEVYKFRLKSSYTFEVSVTDSDGASVSSVFVLLINELPIPTLPSIDIVTPNGDGINDTWFIQGVDRFYNFSVSIYDTSGQLIYFLKDNYDNSWNGQVKGRNLPTGAYFYVLKNNTTGKTYSGTISFFN